VNVLSQLAVNVLITASHYSLVGLTFAVPYLVSRFLNFSMAAPFTVGAYAAWFALCVASLPAAMLAAPLVALLLGVTIHFTVILPLEKRRATPLVLLVATMGIYAVIHNGLSLAFSDASRQLDAPILRQVVQLAGARITSGQLAGIVLAVVALASWGTLQRTFIGIQIRAIAADREQATITGIRVASLELLVTASAFGFGGLVGVVLALDANVTPSLGLNALFMGVVVALVAGKWSIIRIGGWSLMLAVLQTGAGWCLGNEWRHAPAFAVLAGFLILRSWQARDSGQRGAD